MPNFTVTRRSPLSNLGALSSTASISIDDVGATARFVLRGGEVVALEAGRTLNINFPREFGRCVHRGKIAVLWLGPDEWLLLGPAKDESELKNQLGIHLAYLPHSLVSVGHRDAAFIVRGQEVAEAINAGCPLDLRLSAFPIDACTRTLFGKAEIVLWRLDTYAFRIEVARSFAPYVHELLGIAAREVSSV
jgi:sarcosine oxidase subunit gamma